MVSGLLVDGGMALLLDANRDYLSVVSPEVNSCPHENPLTIWISICFSIHWATKF